MLKMGGPKQARVSHLVGAVLLPGHHTASASLGEAPRPLILVQGPFLSVSVEAEMDMGVLGDRDFSVSPRQEAPFAHLLL